MPFTLVHIGAGAHSAANALHHRKLIKRALQASDWLETAQVLERSPWTNTGVGSSLDLTGGVSCDACVIQSNGQRQEIALSQLRSEVPITQAWNVLQDLNQVYGEHTKFGQMGLTQPIVLAEKLLLHLRKHMEEEGMVSRHQKPSEGNLVLARARRLYDTYMGQNQVLDEVTDTVGLVQIQENHIVVASSSGGNFFKLPGRIGCAGIPGCAAEAVVKGLRRVSCLCSGNGEQIVASTLARTVCRALARCEDDLAAVLESTMKEAGALYVGVVAVVETNDAYTVVFCHSTETFYFGFALGRVEVVMSRLEGRGCVRGEFRVRK